MEVRSLSCRLGGRQGLRGINLLLAPGEVHGLLGPRWSGTTTLLRVLAGEIAPSGGVLQVPRQVRLIGGSPIELQLAADVRARVVQTRLMADLPDLVLLDEAAAALEPAAARSLALRCAARGATVVWASRRLDTLVGVAPTVTLLADGRARYAGSVRGLVAAARASSGPAPLGFAA